MMTSLIVIGVRAPDVAESRTVGRVDVALDVDNGVREAEWGRFPREVRRSV